MGNVHIFLMLVSKFLSFLQVLKEVLRTQKPTVGEIPEAAGQRVFVSNSEPSGS